MIAKNKLGNLLWLGANSKSMDRVSFQVDEFLVILKLFCGLDYIRIRILTVNSKTRSNLITSELGEIPGVLAPADLR